MEFKKLVRILTVAVVAVWLFCLSFLVSYQVAEKQQKNTTTNMPPIVTNTPIPGGDTGTTAPTTTLPGSVTDVLNPAPGPQDNTTTAPVAVPGDSTTAPTTQPAAPSVKIPQGNAEIVSTYVNAINGLKASSDFTVYRVGNLDVQIDEITGGSLVEGVAANVIAANQVEPTLYTFAGGAADPATGATPNSILPPLNKQCIINESYVKSATATPTADGGFTLTIELNDEAHIHPNEAENLGNIVEIVDLSALIPSQAKVNYLEIYYTNVYVTANFDSAGRMIYAKNYMAVNQCKGSGSMIGFTMTVVGHGDFYAEYTIGY